MTSQIIESARLERKIVLDCLHLQDVILERKKYDKAHQDAHRNLTYSFFLKNNLKELDDKFHELRKEGLGIIRQEYGNGVLYEFRNIEVEIAPLSRCFPSDQNVLWSWFIYANRLKKNPLSDERLMQGFVKYQKSVSDLRERVRKANSVAIVRKLHENEEAF